MSPENTDIENTDDRRRRLPQRLLEILACPQDKGPLLYFADEHSLYNPRLKRRYDVRDGIPVMLIDEATTVDDAEHDRLVAKATAEGIDAHVRGLRALVRPIDPDRGGVGRLLDSLGMFAAAYGLPEQITVAADSAAAVDGLPSPDGLTSVAIFGMGGSGIGGDVCAAVAGPTCPVPIVVSKHYECPGFVGPDTLVFASSFSGNTEETLAATREAHDRAPGSWR